MPVQMKRLAGALGLSALLLLAPACSGEVPESSSEDETGAAGDPVRGGTLNMLGTSDVDYMDPNVSYYSVGSLNLRMWARQLFTYPAKEGETTVPVPDVATEKPTEDNGGISDDGTTYTITIRDDVMWNSSPERAVVAQDFIRGLKRTCNPVQPFGGIPNFATLIEGYQAFCDGFAEVDPQPAAMADYINNNDISGAQAPDDTTLEFRLTSPATYFVDMLAQTAFSAAPEEWLEYAPASPELAENLLSNGPYQVESWNPTKQIVYTRNPAWNPDSDPVREAYVDRVEVDLTVTEESMQQQLETGTPSADMTFADGPPQSQVPRLINTNDPNLVIGETSSTNPYIIFNTVSPNNNEALADVEVRQAISHALNRDNLIQVLNGPDLNNALAHVLPPNIVGSKDFDLYPHDPDKAQQMLSDAGADGLELKFLYRPASESSVKAFQTVQQDLADVGIKVTGVESPDADFYTKYLQKPEVARRGVWDLSLAGWGADWYGNAALSFFKPLFYGEASFPPIGSNFGMYDSQEAVDLIDQAATATSLDEAAELWAEADRQVMEDAAFFPITNPKEPRYHAEQVNNAVYMAAYQAFDPVNVWLSEGKQGG